MRWLHLILDDEENMPLHARGMDVRRWYTWYKKRIPSVCRKMQIWQEAQGLEEIVTPQCSAEEARRGREKTEQSDVCMTMVR